MELFNLTEDFQIELARPTLAAVPAFAKMLAVRYNVGEPSDSQGNKRLKARREFLYIYYMCDFRSEYGELDEESQHAQACEAAKLDINFKKSEELEGAINKYLQLQDTRPIKAVKAAWKGIDKVIAFLDSATQDKSKEIIETISNLGKLIEGLAKLETQVKRDLTGDSAIRGKAEVGRQG